MIEQTIAELKKLVPFKETTESGDIVLVLAEEEEHPALLYALVTGIERDTTRRDEWWHLSLQLLSVPPQAVVWTLRTPQFTGQESFTMGGKGRFIKAIRIEKPQSVSSPEPKARGGLRLVK
ncbi:hypothetical protein VU05_03760 [Desulfobulbus sp. F1]|jgi:hypothetical protein|nr:hypothetical protein [Desulfobulbus sp. F1]MCW5205419.1 hypothetical protein [Desulfobulbus sp. F5]